MQINSGGNVYDKFGMIRHMIAIANEIEIKGARNIRYITLLIDGLNELYDGMQKEEKAHEHDQTPDGGDV